MSFTVSADRHFFQKPDGSPFFYLGDTVWMLFNKLTEAEARQLFADRAGKGFTVIQSVVFRDLFEPNTPNVAGIRPFETTQDMHAVRMNPRWLEHVVRIVEIAGEYGLVMGLLPTWGDKWNVYSNSAGPVIMDERSGEAYCRLLSDTLGDCRNVLWVLGGDSPVQTQAYADTIRAMARGLRSGRSGRQPITFHPTGPSSSEIFHSEPWLNFNAMQTTHDKPNMPNYVYVERLYNLQPTKPCMDIEPNYELAPMFAIGKHGPQPPLSAVFSAYDVRKAYYRSVLAGAAGFTYGCEPIRQLVRPGDRVHAWDNVAMPTWDVCLSAPGSSQLALLKGLLLERPYYTRRPAQELLLPFKETPAWSDRMGVGLPFVNQLNQDPVAHIRVACCSEGRYLFAYTPVRQVVLLDTSTLASKQLRLRLYDPEGGGCTLELEFENTGRLRFMPQRDMDSLIVIDAL